jgi:hypothetical protein
VEATLMVDRVPYRVRANKGAIDVSVATLGRTRCGLSQAELMQLLTG